MVKSRRKIHYFFCLKNIMAPQTCTPVYEEKYIWTEHQSSLALNPSKNPGYAPLGYGFFCTTTCNGETADLLHQHSICHSHVVNVVAQSGNKQSKYLQVVKKPRHISTLNSTTRAATIIRLKSINRLLK